MTRHNRAQQAQPDTTTQDALERAERVRHDQATRPRPSEPLPDLDWREFGRNGNIFAIAGAVGAAYRRDGRRDEYRRCAPPIITGPYTYDELVALYSSMVRLVDNGPDAEFEDGADDLFDAE